VLQNSPERRLFSQSKNTPAYRVGWKNAHLFLPSILPGYA